MPLGKVFTDGLDKFDRKEGLLKRLKNIEDRSNNQLLAITNIPRPAIKGCFESDDENNGNFGSDDEYKTIQDFKQGLIDKNILLKSGAKKFDKIISNWKQTKDKKIVYKNVDAKFGTKTFNIYKIFENYLNKKINYDGINNIEKSIEDGIKIYKKKPRTYKNKRIIDNSNKIINDIELFKSMIENNEYIFKPNNNVDLDWMINKDGLEEISEEAGKHYIKGKKDNELKLIKDFITKINNGTINNKNKAGNEFRKLKQKVTNYNLGMILLKI